MPMNVCCVSVFRYLICGQDDQVECDEDDRPKRMEEKILSLATVIFSTITLVKSSFTILYACVLVDDRLLDFHNVDQAMIVIYKKVTHCGHTQ